jgi:SOS-response transcriptional repressor LexA
MSMESKIANGYFNVNSTKNIVEDIADCYISDMKNIDEIRKANFTALLSQSVSLRVFAETIETSPAYVSQLNTGHRKIGNNLARRIEKNLSLPKNWMDQDHGDEIDVRLMPPKSPPSLKAVAILPSASKIPVLSDEISEGWGIVPYRTEVIMGFVDSTAGASEQAFGVLVQGRGMEPEFFEGELVIVDPRAPVENGNYVVVVLHGQTRILLRRLVVEPDGRRYLEGLHPVYGGMPLLLEESPRFMGKIIEKRKRY